jgi:Tol biopolymer transport system component
MRFHTLYAAIPAAALAASACADGTTSTSPLTSAPPALHAEAALTLQGDRLATIEQEGATPALYIQNADGSGRFRVHFDHVHGHVTGNYSSRQLPVTDQSILTIRRARWSPDGMHLAVIVQPAFDAAQVVLVSADGHDLRTVSPNSQYLFGDVEWSPDSRRIAYIVATGPYATHPDLFVTDLGPDQVRRVTTSGRLSGYDTFRFDATGDRLIFTEHLGWASDGVNVLSQLGDADLTTGTVSYGAQVVGEPQGFPRDGSWLLLIRWGGAKAGARELVKLPLSGARETVLSSGDLWNAVMLEGDDRALVVAPDPNDRSGSTLAFRVMGLDTPDDVRTTLPTGANVTWAALLP